MATASSAVKLSRRARPSDPAWPGSDRWAALQSQLTGELLEPTALFGTCIARPDSESCLEAHKYISNPFWIGDQVAGTQVSGWLNAWTPEPSRYAIKARTAGDIAAGVNFARRHNLRLVIKGAGHSYLGTSNAPDSLQLWTRAMNEVRLHDAFVGQGCEGQATPVQAVSAGAGAVWMDLYAAVTVDGDRYVQGGGCTDVGVAGLVLSGGFGSFSKCFGTAASGLIEAEIVTADGQIRVVNACRDPDLFWALKGGGGGTFGVITRLTLQTHVLPTSFGSVWGTIQAHSDAAYKRLLDRFLRFYRDDLLNEHWGEQVYIKPDNSLEVSMVCAGLDDTQMRAPWQPFAEWLSASAREYAWTHALSFHRQDPRGWWNCESNPSMIRDLRPGARSSNAWWEGDQEQVGVFIHGFESLWLPASLLAGKQRAVLADALFSASRHKRVQLHFNKGLAGSSRAVRNRLGDTATHPKAADAFALAIIADGEAPTYAGLARSIDLPAALQDAGSITRAAAELRKLVSTPGSYVSESNYFNPSWQDAYWGPNYPALRAIKKKYDPDGLFVVHHGVGSEDWSTDGFTRRSAGS